MKVVLVHAADRGVGVGGGAEQLVSTLHDAIRARGHACSRWVGYKHGSDEDTFTVSRERPFPFALGAVRRLEHTFGLQNLYAPGIRRLAEDLPADVDVVHVHSLWGSGNYADLGGLVRLAHRFKVVLTLHDEWMITGHCAYTRDCDRWKTGCGRCPSLNEAPSISRDGTRINFWRKRVAMRSINLHVTTVSDALRRKVCMSPIMQGKPVSVAHNGIDIGNFSPGDRIAARRRFGLPGSGPVALLAGKTVFGVERGLAQHAAMALNEVSELGITALVVGPGADKVAASLRCPSVVLPHQTDRGALADCYRAADFTLVASEAETFGLIAAESQACGTPVICTDVGGLPEVVASGVGGIVVPVRSVEGFVEGIRRLCNDRSLWQRMSTGGVEWVRERFSDDVMVEGFLDLYRRL